jgi:pilus assembly protein CpaC
MDIRRPGATIVIVAVLGSVRLYAQTAPPVQTTAARAPMAATMATGAPTDQNAARPVSVKVGRSTVVDVGAAITRVSLTSADVADAMVTSPNELLLNGKAPGTISMFVWDRNGGSRHYEITVQRDLTKLTEQFAQLMTGEEVKAESNGKNIVLSGKVSNKDMIERAINLATGYVDKKEEVLSLLQIRDGAPSNQVLLRVRFAEVSRSAMTELGVNLLTAPYGVKNNVVRTTTGQFSPPDFTDLSVTKSSTAWGSDVTSATGKIAFSDFLNVFLFNNKYDIGAVIKALQTKGLFQSLAEPNLVTESGKEASFLAGGEYPIPIAQGGSGSVAITVSYKEYGIRLNFLPIVNGDRVHLKVRPEVSTLDFANAVILNGFRIPALSSRRTESEVELQNGQTFAVAGLMNNQVNSTLQKIPGIGDIPILGALFSSKAAQKQQTELVVMITPEILPNNSSGVTTTLPRPVEQYMPPVAPKKGVDQPAPAFKNQGASVTAPIVPTAAATPAAPANTNPSARDAAATIKALNPNTRTVVNGDATPAATTATTQSVGRPLTDSEKKALERAHKLEQEQQQATAKAKSVEDAKTQKDAQAKAAKQGEDDRRRLEAEKKQAALDKELQEKAAKEQAKRDAADKKKQVEVDKQQAELQKQRDELDRKRAELDKKAAEVSTQKAQ